MKSRAKRCTNRPRNSNALETEVVFTRAALADAQQQLEQAASGDDWKERYARLQAETENIRRRLDQRAAGETAANRRRILADMVPLADHLDLALEHAPTPDDDAVRELHRQHRRHAPRLPRRAAPLRHRTTGDTGSALRSNPARGDRPGAVGHDAGRPRSPRSAGGLRGHGRRQPAGAAGAGDREQRAGLATAQRAELPAATRWAALA